MMHDRCLERERERKNKVEAMILATFLINIRKKNEE